MAHLNTATRRPARDEVMAMLLDSLAGRVPDFHDIANIFTEMVTEHRENTAHIVDENKT